MTTMTGAPELDEEAAFTAAVAGCDRAIFWRREVPAETMARLAEVAAELGVELDTYGENGAVAQVESEVAALLGKPAAALWPSGTMAQQAALRVWCDQVGSTRVALPQVSHLVQHEEDAALQLHGLRWEYLTTATTLPTAADLSGIPGRLGAVLLEIPMAQAHWQMPTWDELVAFSDAARDRGVPFHLDGARLWEAQSGLGHEMSEIADLCDSVYVSFYKGLGAFAGAMLLGDLDFIEETKRWRHRMGGTLYRMTPFALDALDGLRTHLPRMPEYLAWARELAAELDHRGFCVAGGVPQISTFDVYLDADAEALNRRSITAMQRDRVVLPRWHTSADPGRARTTLSVYAAAMDWTPAEIADRLARLAECD